MRIIRVLQFLLWSLFRFILPPCMSLVPLPTAPTGRCGISAPTHHFQCICPLTPSRINYGIALNHRRFLCSLQFNWVSTEAIKLQIAQGKPREKPLCPAHFWTHNLRCAVKCVHFHNSFLSNNPHIHQLLQPIPLHYYYYYISQFTCLFLYLIRHQHLFFFPADNWDYRHRHKITSCNSGI